MEKTKEELNKYFWHRLYKVLVWLINISSMGVGIIYGWALGFNLPTILLLAVAISFLSFLFIFIIYRTILYIAFNGKFFLNKKDLKFFIASLIILVILSVVFWITYKQYEAPKKIAECKYRIVKSVFDPNMYLRDISYGGIGGRLLEGTKTNKIIDILAFLTKKSPEEIKNEIYSEAIDFKLRNGGSQKIIDMVGSIDLESLDYNNPEFLSSYCR